MKRYNIDGCVGTSAGALLSLAICIGVEDRIGEALKSIDWAALRGLTVTSFFDTFGLKQHGALISVVETILAYAGLHAHITMQDLHRLTHKSFCCCVSDVRNSKVTYMDHKAFPHVRVCDAVVASMCVPVLFEPYTIDGVMYVDGGLTENVPINYFPEDESVILRVVGESTNLSNWREYLLSLLRCAQIAREDRAVAKLARVHTLIIPQHVPQSMEMGAINHELIRYLLVSGYIQCLPEKGADVCHFAGTAVEVLMAWICVDLLD